MQNSIHRVLEEGVNASDWDEFKEREAQKLELKHQGCVATDYVRFAVEVIGCYNACNSR